MQIRYRRHIISKYGKAIPNLPIILSHVQPWFPKLRKNLLVSLCVLFLLFRTDVNGSVRERPFHNFRLHDGNMANKKSVGQATEKSLKFRHGKYSSQELRKSVSNTNYLRLHNTSVLLYRAIDRFQFLRLR